MSGSGRVVGKHVYGSLYGVDREKLEDVEFVMYAVAEAVKASGATLATVHANLFRTGDEKWGVSVIAVVLESHFAVHTWPEYGYATVDVYTCGESTNPMAGFKVIVDLFEPEKVTFNEVDRSQEG